MYGLWHLLESVIKGFDQPIWFRVISHPQWPIEYDKPERLYHSIFFITENHRSYDLIISFQGLDGTIIIVSSIKIWWLDTVYIIWGHVYTSEDKPINHEIYLLWICRRMQGSNNYTLVNVLPSCTETEHSQQEVLTLTQMSSPVTTDTDATQHPDTKRPGNASKRADSAHKQLDRTSSPTRLHLSPLSSFQRRITRLTTQRELRTPRVPATQQQWQPASQLEARARSRDVPTATYVTHYGAHSLNPKTRALPHSSPFY